LQPQFNKKRSLKKIIKKVWEIKKSLYLCAPKNKGATIKKIKKSFGEIKKTINFAAPKRNELKLSEE